MTDTPLFHHRRNLRLRGYDYSQAGLYFVTICAKKRACLFGEIHNRKIQLNNAGQMVETNGLNYTNVSKTFIYTNTL